MLNNDQNQPQFAFFTQQLEMLRSELLASQAANEALRRELESQKAAYLALSQTVTQLVAERDALKLKVSELEAANKRLTEMLWGRRSERSKVGTASPPLNFGDAADGVLDTSSEPLPPGVIEAQQAAQKAYDAAKLAELESRRQARRKRNEEQGSREAFPDHIERREVILDLTEEEKIGLRYIGTKTTERMHFEKPNVYIKKTIRYLYVCEEDREANQSPIVKVPVAPAIVEGCKYDFSVIAAIAAMKFGFHMPTFREQNFFGQIGWTPSRSTINDLINLAVECITPLYTEMLRLVLRQPILFGDATCITVLLRSQLSEDDQRALDRRQANRNGHLPPQAKAASEEDSVRSLRHGSAQSFAWLYSGLDAPREFIPNCLLVPGQERPPPNFEDPCWGYAPYNLFHWSLTQKNSVIDDHLASFQGTFVGDAAGVNAYLATRSDGRIAHQSCNAHARRYFEKAKSNDPELSSQMIAMYRQLYAVEYRAASLSVGERLELRQREAVPIWNRIERWLSQGKVKQVLAKSPIGKAVAYLRNQFDALRRYLTDGALPIDNNHSERTIRPLTIGRKNWMFLGSMESAPGRMQLYSIVSSAYRHGLSLQDYLEDIFLKLSQASQHRPRDLEPGSALLQSLLPDRWGAMHPERVLRDRLEERRQVAENREFYRLQAGLAGLHPYGQSFGLIPETDNL